MSRQAIEQTYAEFIGGFSSEYNELSRPEGILKDVVNFIVTKRGTLEKRPGLLTVKESFLGNFSGALSNENSYQAFLWELKDHPEIEQVLVLQMGAFLLFFERKEDEILFQNFDIRFFGTLQSPANSLYSGHFSFSQSQDKLIVCTGNAKPKIVSLSKTPGVFSVSLRDIDIKVRDTSVWRYQTGVNPVGLNEGWSPESNWWTDDQVTGFETWRNLGALHRYNLENAGWDREVSLINRANGSSNNEHYVGKPLPHIRWAYESGNMTSDMRRRCFPAINIPLWYCRHGAGERQWQVEAFYPWSIPNAAFGNSEPLTGFRIVDFSDWQRGRTTGFQTTITSSGNFVSATQTYKVDRHPTVTAFYSDRVWYAGAKGYRSEREPEFLQTENIDVSTNIYFSQALRGDISRAGLCYQAADPTAEDINDLVATDGGVISIPEMGEVIYMAVFGSSLIVFADNGVWAISGLDGNLFQADNMSITKVSDAVAPSKTSIAEEENSLVFSGTDAIYALQSSDISGMPQIVDISSERIGRFYERISNRSKKGSYAILDNKANIFYMFYSDIPEESITENISLVAEVIYNKALVVNLNTGAFYRYEFPLRGADGTGTSYICVIGGFYSNRDSRTVVQDNVVHNGDNVVESWQNVVQGRTLSFVSDNNIHLIGLEGGRNGSSDNVYIHELRFDDTTNWLDLDYDHVYAYAELGFDSLGDLLRKSKMVPKIVTHMIRTETNFGFPDLLPGPIEPS